ncbi:hypothetical protein JKF63_05329 [Porcisia hertigi]|uniref:CSC1/OSCA1-like 7TM region domain-containing protein n=1 Tax=Porcisia hertigi TaxID=2761500 RepID=A0A836HZV8_9TRYP|nr:hypothetical protein JKF63_05329 [Porcisia hertigi]
MSTVNPLPADATYDDQGVYVSLIIGGVVLVVFGGLIAFLHYTPILWLKRFYRPNHTIEPTPPTKAPSAAAIAAARRVAREDLHDTLSPPTSPLTEVAFAEHTIRPHGKKGHSVTRRKRLGVSLPILSTFFIRPTWKDWISIEEPSLADRKESALSPVHHQTPSLPPRQTSDRSFVPLTAPPSPFLHRRNNKQVGRTELKSDCRYLVEAPADFTAFSPRSKSSLPSYGAVEKSCTPPCPPSTPGSTTWSSAAMPKTPLDPLVAVYLFTLKFFFSLMLLGELFTAWIMLIAQRDNHMEQTLIERDMHNCSGQGNNVTGCELLKPYCSYQDDTLGCSVVALHGLYDLTVLNIHPRSQRWVGVALLNLGFCVALVGLTLFYVKKVGHYAEAVMVNQMHHALGYRVVCVRGIDSTDIRTDRAFREAFLQLSVYFPTPSTPRAPRSASSEAHLQSCRDSSNFPAPLHPNNGTSEDDDNEDSYAVCQCPGLNCLFSISDMHYYVLRRSDATFTEPDKVEQILITREPPIGMLELIAETEAAMANLQEAIADEKALQRRLMLRHRTRTLTKRRRRASVVVNDDDVGPVGNVYVHDSPGDDGRNAVLMMRAPFPDCCSKVPAVPYYTAVFLRCSRDMNMALERVPHQQAAGAAFVVFKDSLCAHEFTQLFTARFGGLFSSLVATIAGPPGRIFQSTLTASRCTLWVRFFLIFVLYIVLILTWSIPISVLGSLEQLSEISSFVLLRKYSKLPKWLRTLINSYLPVLALAIFNIALPHIIRLLVRAMGAFNRAECDSGQLYLQYIFMVLTAVIFQAAFQGAVTGLPYLLFESDRDAIINFFVSCISPSNGYFYAKVITSTCLSTWIDLLDPIGILKVLLLRGQAHVQRNYDALFLPCEFEFPRLLSFDLMVLSMGLLFHMTAPLLGLLVVGYFLVRYWSQRAKQCDRYRPTLSPAHDCTDFGVAAQVIRCVMGLYCFSEVCGVVLMTLRSHRTGIVISALTLTTGVTLMIYVYGQTAKWTASLANARHFARNPQTLYNQRAAQQTESGRTVISPPQASQPQEVSSASGGNASTSAPASSFQQHTSSGHLCEVEDAATEQECSPHNHGTAMKEEGVLDSYEHVTLNLVLFDTTRNPYLSYLLPRKPGTVLRYQPKHQRLATINAAAELRAMKDTDFVVERYWDRGMTWFEGDADASRSLEDLVGVCSGDNDEVVLTHIEREEAPHTKHAHLMGDHDALVAQASAAVPPSVSSGLPTAAAVSRPGLSTTTLDAAKQKTSFGVIPTSTPTAADEPVAENRQCDAVKSQVPTHMSVLTTIEATAPTAPSHPPLSLPSGLTTPTAEHRKSKTDASHET